MTRLSDEDLEWFRDRASRIGSTALSNIGLGRIAAEVDRLREGLRLATDWLRQEEDGGGKWTATRDAFRRWLEESEKDEC